MKKYILMILAFAGISTFNFTNISTNAVIGGLCWSLATYSVKHKKIDKNGKNFLTKKTIYDHCSSFASGWIAARFSTIVFNHIKDMIQSESHTLDVLNVVIVGSFAAITIFNLLKSLKTKESPKETLKKNALWLIPGKLSLDILKTIVSACYGLAYCIQ